MPAWSVLPLRTRSQTARPFGRKLGKRCDVSFCDASTVVTAVGTPPVSAILNSGRLLLKLKMMSPVRFQAPPLGSGASERLRQLSRNADAFELAVGEEADRQRVGRPKWVEKPDVPASGTGSVESNDCSQSCDWSLPTDATNTSCPPSGEIAS